MLSPGKSQPRPLCRTAAECLAAGWEAGEDDIITPSIRLRWKAIGLEVRLAEMALARDRGPQHPANGGRRISAGS